MYQIEMRHAEIGGLAAVLIASIDCRCADREKNHKQPKLSVLLLGHDHRRIRTNDRFAAFAPKINWLLQREMVTFESSCKMNPDRVAQHQISNKYRIYICTNGIVMTAAATRID
jgi:hypothetical protein